MPIVQGTDTTCVKGRFWRTVKVLQIPAAMPTNKATGYISPFMDSRWIARVESGQLGYPHNNSGDGTHDFATQAEASYEAGRIVGLWLKDGWQFCENWRAERSLERMQTARLEWPPLRKLKNKNDPLYFSIAYPEPWHLASYISVMMASGTAGDGVFQYDYPSAKAANTEASHRIDAAVEKGYRLLPQSAEKTAGNVATVAPAWIQNGIATAYAASKLPPGVKLALAPQPVPDDFSEFVKEFKWVAGNVNDEAVLVASVENNNLGKKFLALICNHRPIAVSQLGEVQQKLAGVFYPLAIDQKVEHVGGYTTTYKITATGVVVYAKHVANATMPAMEIKQNFNQIINELTPPEPTKIRHLEFED